MVFAISVLVYAGEDQGADLISTSSKGQDALNHVAPSGVHYHHTAVVGRTGTTRAETEDHSHNAILLEIACCGMARARSRQNNVSDLCFDRTMRAKCFKEMTRTQHSKGHGGLSEERRKMHQCLQRIFSKEGPLSSNPLFSSYSATKLQASCACTDTQALLPPPPAPQLCFLCSCQYQYIRLGEFFSSKRGEV